MDLGTQLMRVIQDVNVGTEVYGVNDPEMLNLMYREVEEWQRERSFSPQVLEEFKKLPPNKVLLAHEKIQRVLFGSK